MKKEVKRQILTESLPKWGKSGHGVKGTINWLESIGHKVKGIYNGIEFEVEIIKYDAKKNRLTVLYNNEEFEILACSFRDCKFGEMLKKNTTDFKIEINARLEDRKRDLIIINREYRVRYNEDGSFKQNEKWYNYQCNKCGWDEGWMIESNLLYLEQGCSCCRGYTLVQGINDIPTTAPWLIPYFQGGIEEARLYNKNGGGNSDNPKGLIMPVCPDCGRVKSKKISISSIQQCHSIGCSCSDGQSYPNKFAFKMLEELGIDFEAEYSPDWIGKKCYDFYVPSTNLILEMDGRFHNINNKMNGRTQKESKDIDDYKDKMAKEHGVEVIRIDCNYKSEDRFEYVKNSVLKNNRLKELFILNKINWEKVMEFAVSNLTIIACDYKKNNPDLTPNDIARIMKLDRTTVANYLKEGTKLNWCEYCPIKESKKGSIKGGKSNAKPVEIFKNGISLGNFPSCTELENRSEELFKEKLDHKSISAVCTGAREQYKGYTFKYLTPEEIEQIQSDALKQAI
jgi:protein-tyrosine-phosphatase